MSSTSSVICITKFLRSDAPCAPPAQKDILYRILECENLPDIRSQAVTMSMLRNYQVDIDCSLEVRLGGTGIRADSHYRFYHSDPSKQGVAVPSSHHPYSVLFSWQSTSSRAVNFTVVATYIPTLPCNSSVKDEFKQ